MARELAPAGPRSGPLIHEKKRTAAQSSGSKLPRHSILIDWVRRYRVRGYSISIGPLVPASLSIQ
ncbi:MAG: hypothetical protein C0411_13460 [Pseudomonas sp.]|nr:hypothetical protein [Pseudomonas sp.]